MRTKPAVYLLAGKRGWWKSYEAMHLLCPLIDINLNFDALKPLLVLQVILRNGTRMAQARLLRFGGRGGVETVTWLY